MKLTTSFLIVLFFFTACTELKKLEKCAKNDDIECINFLVEHYRKVDKNHDIKKATFWARKGVELNDPSSMVGLANLIGSDSPEAWTLYQKAAQLGDVDAMLRVGNKYLCNRGNSDSAYYWVNKSQMEGNTSAYKTIADLNYKGIGTKKNYPLALYYYKKGCDRGIDNNYICCDSVISLINTKFLNDTFDLQYWKERRKEVVLPSSYK